LKFRRIRRRDGREVINSDNENQSIGHTEESKIFIHYRTLVGTSERGHSERNCVLSEAEGRSVVEERLRERPSTSLRSAQDARFGST
jgi:hypothetical protein